MSTQNVIFRCDTDEKIKFMVEAEQLGLDASFLLRRMVHLFLHDTYFKQRVLNLHDEDSYGWEF
ncbi:MAG: hypothetical protein IKR85_07210 [Clostridia bacterium]|nr:hypothetical protein [Clostridia bacterium]